MTGLAFGVRRAVLKHVNHWRGRVVFIHINKTGGTSVERALHLRSERIPALEKRRRMGAARFARAYKFAFVRNPWDKVVSHYLYRVRTGRTGLSDGHLPFGDWVRRAYGERDPRYVDVPLMFAAQTDWVCDEDGRMLLDFVGRFERLAEDFAVVCRAIGSEARLPHVKTTQHGHYRGYYADDTREIVAERFASDLERFGYEF